ncbi:MULTISPECIES: M15 family metallopeptidase [Terrabacteria group]|uniref:M15 family metallopeptidase n=1 Tax=Bacillati TaxID=1783272 RepID=UPI001C6ED1A1|nr:MULTISPECIES: M15 family metallopeptidase [Terrabacteria group]MBW9212899.1 M15 family metallopeptidase [Trueperella sp. zg.1013]
MNLLQKKYMAILLSSLVGISACSFLLLNMKSSSSKVPEVIHHGQAKDQSNIPTSESNSSIQKKTYSFNKLGSVSFYLSKKNPIPRDYKPSDLVKVNVQSLREEQLRREASDAVQTLFKAAKQDGYSLQLISAYRSYEYQQKLYKSYLKKSSKSDLDRIDNLPGKSEHQLGLAIDLGDESRKYLLKESFANTNLFKWLEKNSYKYGYILRYPDGKEDVTGYKFHPWSFRYVGKELALEIYKSGLTFDEFVQKK